MMPRFLYTLLLYAVLPFTPLKLWWRGIRQPEYRQHWAERFGFYQLKTDKPIIWLHCVSVGETHAAAPLIKSLQQRFPQYQILLTHTTPTGRSASEKLFGNGVLRAYLPYDVPDAVYRFLKHFKPHMGMLMETELWFNLIAACNAKQIPLFLVNARLSEKSAAAYAKVKSLTQQGLQNLTYIAAQTNEDAVRFIALGAKNIETLGNLKFDVTPPKDAQTQGDKLRALLGKNRPVLLAASTREGEEALIINAVKQLISPNLLTLIVPRHPQRFNEVAKLLETNRLSYIRRSSFQEPLPNDVAVVLGDTMGEMFTYYAACDVALIGGSLLPFGGQNLIEACAMHKPVILGQHTYNFNWAAEQAIKYGAAMRVELNDLELGLDRVLADKPLQQKMGELAYQFSQSAAGASEKTMRLVSQYLP
jgi:3-deoxy-D-manno-octulosonic-acid transferase